MGGVLEAATDLEGLWVFEEGVPLTSQSGIGRESVVVVVRLKLSVQHRIPGKLMARELGLGPPLVDIFLEEFCHDVCLLSG